MEEVLLKDQYFDHKQVDSTGCFRRHSIKLKRYRDNFTEITLADNAVDTPLSGNNEATEVSMPSPKKSRKGIKKRAISVPISECDGSRSKGEVYPPSDSWSWRKYGQKPIKGSPYPRGYYKCSSSKGCPARKQVERSHHDPTMLVITYSSDHNHTLPPAASKHRHPTTPTSIPITTPASTDTNNSPAATLEDEVAVFTYQPNNDFPEIPGELGWFSDVGSTLMESTSLVGSTWIDNDAAVMLPIGEEDKSLFGDLGELPECSVVFRRYSVDSPCTD